jgi:hypothetical protein
MMQFLAQRNGQGGGMPARLEEDFGEAAGITYHSRGSGPPLVLFPLGLNPSQWEPLFRD